MTPPINNTDVFLLSPSSYKTVHCTSRSFSHFHNSVSTFLLLSFRFFRKNIKLQSLLFSETSFLFLLYFGPPAFGLLRRNHLVAFDLFLFDKILSCCTAYMVYEMQILVDPTLPQQSLLRKISVYLTFDVYERSTLFTHGILFIGKTLPHFCFFCFFTSLRLTELAIMFSSSKP